MDHRSFPARLGIWGSRCDKSTGASTRPLSDSLTLCIVWEGGKNSASWEMYHSNGRGHVTLNINSDPKQTDPSLPPSNALYEVLAKASPWQIEFCLATCNGRYHLAYIPDSCQIIKRYGNNQIPEHTEGCMHVLEIANIQWTGTPLQMNIILRLVLHFFY